MGDDDRATLIPQPGMVLADKYRVDRVLGKGGMGYVVAATHVHLDEPVALKFLHPSVASDADLVTRFLREAKAALKIRGEHVVRVLDVGTLADGAPYMVMEYLDGGDLDAVARKSGRQPVPVVVDYVLQACEALAEAHTQGMVHRDLKPANLFLTQRADGKPLVKVLDFGISKVTGAAGSDLGLTKTNANVMGSPLYMSPEQMRSLRDVDQRSDIWALGVILYELLVGSPPYNATSWPELCVAILQDPPPPISLARNDVPRPLEAAIHRCMEKDPARRFQNVAELAAALAPFGSAEGAASAAFIYGVVEAKSGGARASASGVPALAGPGAPPNPSSGAPGVPPVARSVTANLHSAASPDASRPSAPSPLGISTGRAATGGAWGGTQKPPVTKPVAAVIVSGVLLFVAVAAGVASMLRSGHFGRDGGTVASSSASSAPSPAATLPPSNETPNEATSAPSAVPAASVSAEPAPSRSETARPTPPPPHPDPPAVVKSAASPAPQAATPPPAVTSSKPAAPAPARPNCKPPYELDAAGNKHWKRECI
jgi:serine/threonine-protein kinase